MHYRRNTDEDLRSLERKFAAEPTDRALLMQIDRIRQRSSMPAHPQTRIAVALDRQAEMQYQSFMILQREILPHLNELLTNHFELYRTDVQVTLAIRNDAMEDAINTIRHGKSSRQWTTLLRNGGLPSWVRLNEEELALTKLSHAKWEKHPRRSEVSDRIRRQADAHCHELLNFFSRQSLFQLEVLWNIYEDQQEIDQVLHRIADVLEGWDLSHEEYYRARLGDAPNPDFVIRFGELWWRGL